MIYIFILLLWKWCFSFWLFLYCIPSFTSSFTNKKKDLQHCVWRLLALHTWDIAANHVTFQTINVTCSTPPPSPMMECTSEPSHYFLSFLLITKPGYSLFSFLPMNFLLVSFFSPFILLPPCASATHPHLCSTLYAPFPLSIHLIFPDHHSLYS